MKSKASTEWSTISHPSRRVRLSGNETCCLRLLCNNTYVTKNKK